jgi:hypothetical protein
LCCAVEAAKTSSDLRLEGAARLPEGTVLTIVLQRLGERSASGTLVPDQGLTKWISLRTVKGKEIPPFDSRAEGPGSYHATVEIEEGKQPKSVIEALRRNAASRRWEFELAAWGDKLASKLHPGLLEVDRWASEAIDLIDRFAQASASEESWRQVRKAYILEVAQFIHRIGEADSAKIYSAAVGALQSALRILRGSAPYFRFKEDGTFAGTSNYHTLATGKGAEDKGFGLFDHLKKDVNEVVALAGRELALWIIKDIRRGGMRAELSEIIEKQASHPGVPAFAERLARAEDLDLLEEEVRSGK